MFHITWHIFDIIVSLFFLFYTFRGVQQGFLHQIASIIPWWGAMILGILLSPWLIKPLAPYVPLPVLPYIAAIAGASLVFGLLTFGVQGVNHLLKKTPLSWMSPVLGAVLGVSYACVWVALLVVACSFEPLASQPWIKESVIIQKGLALMTQIAYFELWKGKFFLAPSWVNIRTYLTS